MRYCGVLVLVVLTSCSGSNSGKSNLLPPSTNDAAGDDGTPGTRRPGDPAPSGEGDSGAGAADAVPAPAGPDAGQTPAGPDVAAPLPKDAAELPADTSPPLPRDTAALPADSGSVVDVGVTWDANMLLTDCGITKQWVPKKSYPKYEFALNYGHIFQCLGEPPNQALPSPASDCKSPEYEPGKPGGPWMAAWFDSGICR